MSRLSRMTLIACGLAFVAGVYQNCAPQPEGKFLGTSNSSTTNTDGLTLRSPTGTMQSGMDIVFSVEGDGLNGAGPAQWTASVNGDGSVCAVAMTSAYSATVRCSTPGSLHVEMSVVLANKKLSKLVFDATLDTPPIDPIFSFDILAGTGNRGWNVESSTINVFQGQTIQFNNKDSVTHRLHTSGMPCPHGNDIPMGASDSCYASQVYAPPTGATADVYDHYSGPTAKVWIKVIRPPLFGPALYQINCQICHGPLASSARRNATKADIDAAISTRPPMMKLNFLSSDERQAISDALRQ